MKLTNNQRACKLRAIADIYEHKAQFEVRYCYTNGDWSDWHPVNSKEIEINFSLEDAITNDGIDVRLYDNSELKKAFANGKQIQILMPAGTWCNIDTPTWDKSMTYRVSPWKLPDPPQGKEWLRPSQWTEKMLPLGYRPALIGEAIDGDFEFNTNLGKWKAVQKNTASMFYAQPNCNQLILYRTKKPVPPSKKYIPLTPVDIIPNSIFRFHKWPEGVHFSYIKIETRGIHFNGQDPVLTWVELMRDG